MRRILWTGAVAWLGVCSVMAQQPGSDAILTRVEERWKAVQDYVVDLRVTVDMQRIKVPDMLVTMYFKSPDKIHFESGSFAMLPREGLALNPAELRSRYDAEAQGREMLDGVNTYKLRLRAKSETAMLRQLYLWVDADKWTVIRLESVPFERRRVRIDFNYRQWEGTYWLPDTLVARYETLEADSLGEPTGVPPDVAAPVDRFRRAPRSGSMRIVYSNYRINIGLPDELFEKRKEEK